MRQVILGVVAGMVMLPMATAQAATQDQSVVDQVKAATQNDESVSAAQQDIECKLSDIQKSIQCLLNKATNDAQKEAILSAAMSLNSQNDEAITAITLAAVDAKVSQDILNRAAGTAGTTAQMLSSLPDTAAGNSQGQGQGQGRGLGVAPGQTGIGITPVPFGNNAGSGGGGNASPNA